MPTLFFVRDGRGDYHTSASHDVNLQSAREVARRFGTRYSLEGPVINDGVASAFAPFRHVVLEIAEGECGGPFRRAGFYYILGLSPAEAKQLFVIENISD